jgi:hypothetical protein
MIDDQPTDKQATWVVRPAPLLLEELVGGWRQEDPVPKEVENWRRRGGLAQVRRTIFKQKFQRLPPNPSSLQQLFYYTRHVKQPRTENRIVSNEL